MDYTVCVLSATANLGVADKKHGRLKSEGVKDRYISEDFKNFIICF